MKAHYTCQECGEIMDIDGLGSVPICPCCGSDDLELKEDE